MNYSFYRSEEICVRFVKQGCFSLPEGASIGDAWAHSTNEYFLQACKWNLNIETQYYYNCKFFIESVLIKQQLFMFFACFGANQMQYFGLYFEQLNIENNISTFVNCFDESVFSPTTTLFRLSPG